MTRLESYGPLAVSRGLVYAVTRLQNVFQCTYTALKKKLKAYNNVFWWFHCCCSPAHQAVFRKAMVFHEMGQVDKALQVFLQCLALDEDFHAAKRQVEAVSLPAVHLLRVGVREPRYSTSEESVALFLASVINWLQATCGIVSKHWACYDSKISVV